jgi:PIN domain nuclease of toxin-antitoxin system
MIYLVDTHVLIWLAVDSPRLSEAARALLTDPDNNIFFSAISIFEIATKDRLSKRGFDVESSAIRRMMIENDFAELAVTGLHAAHVATLPLVHRDPFDRLLVAQATIEGYTLVTADEKVVQYPGCPILKI